MTVKVLPYVSASNSARVLAEALGCRRMRTGGSTLRDSSNLTIINWGNTGTDLSAYTEATVLNRNVRRVSNKRTFFQNIESWNEHHPESTVNIPPFTTGREVAQEWANERKSVVVRNVLAGNSGEGIELIKAVGERDVAPIVPEAPLYTQYVKKRDEYRVHVVKGVVTDVQRKARSTSTPDADVNWSIRNTDGGFIFARDGITPDSSVMEQAKLAVLASGLDFGAVDIIWNAHQRKAYVLEINTACGLEGTTLERYTAAFIAVLRGDSPQEVDMSVVDEVAVEEVTEAPTLPRALEVGDRVRINPDMRSSTSNLYVSDGMRLLQERRAILTVGRISRVSGRLDCGDWTYEHEWLTLVEEGESPETSGEAPTVSPHEFAVGDMVAVTHLPDEDEVMGPSGTLNILPSMRGSMGSVLEVRRASIRSFPDRVYLSDGCHYLNTWLTLQEVGAIAPPVATPAPTPSPIEQAAEEIQLILDGINLTYGSSREVDFRSVGGELMTVRQAGSSIHSWPPVARQGVCQAHVRGRLRIGYNISGGAS